MIRKTLLVVDDDPSCTRFLVSKVHEETPLVALGAEDLRHAGSLVRDLRIQIDGILSDVHFAPGSDDPDNELIDELDLLSLAQKLRPSTKSYVLSFFEGHEEYRTRAAQLDLSIAQWFRKLVYAGPQTDSIWNVIAKDLLGSEAERRVASAHVEFDVFLAHNSRDKDFVERIGRDLERYGLRPWLDKWEIPPGRTFQDAISEAIERTRSVAVIVGPNGVGPWQDLEQKAAISEFVRRKAPVIPVLLHLTVREAKLPLFLREFNCVYFNDNGPYAESLSALVWGIKAPLPDPRASTSPRGR